MSTPAILDFARKPIDVALVRVLLRVRSHRVVLRVDHAASTVTVCWIARDP